MSYLRRVCMAASVAAVEGQTDKTSKWKSNLLLLPPLNSTINNMSSSFIQDSSDYHSRIHNFAAAAGGDNQDSLQRVIKENKESSTQITANTAVKSNNNGGWKNNNRGKSNNNSTGNQYNSSNQSGGGNQFRQGTQAIDGTQFRQVGFLGEKASSEKVFGVRSGDTCTGITQMFKLSTVTFDSNNPNLKCDALLSVNGSVFCLIKY
ncbi:hypothetical protein QYF36_009531 [Acer negundo]|nr:hypothetical protein QYF36_009531 [Acer negundo]